MNVGISKVDIMKQNVGTLNFIINTLNLLILL